MRYKKSILVNVTDEQYEGISKLAANEGRSLSGQLRYLVIKALEENVLPEEEYFEKLGKISTIHGSQISLD